MADTTVLGAKQIKGTGFRGSEPDVGGDAGHRVLFDAEGRDVKAVQHIFRGNLHPYRPSHRHVKAVAAAPVFVVEAP